jgi:hypothetical protein
MMEIRQSARERYLFIPLPQATKYKTTRYDTSRATEPPRQHAPRTASKFQLPSSPSPLPLYISKHSHTTAPPHATHQSLLPAAPRAALAHAPQPAHPRPPRRAPWLSSAPSTPAIGSAPPARAVAPCDRSAGGPGSLRGVSFCGACKCRSDAKLGQGQAFLGFAWR